MVIFFIWFAKFIAFVCRFLKLGAGGTWPGHLALLLYPNTIRCLEGKLSKGSILISGTNGKTTTAKMLTSVLKQASYSVVFNPTGANLLNGIASALVADMDLLGRPRSEVGVFEIDEAAFPEALRFYNPEIVVVLNLFRDQLDRYGEIDLAAEKIHHALKKLPPTSVVVLNRDNSYVSSLGKGLQAKVLYFGDEVASAYSDAYCSRFTFSGVVFAIPLGGVFNVYNSLAAVTVARCLGVALDVAQKTLKDFHPAFGRQEEFVVRGRKVRILLSKNPAGFNGNVRMLRPLRGIASVLLVLNDNIPDGRDVSWVWDTTPSGLLAISRNIVVSGLRAEDMILRLKYCRREAPASRFSKLLISKNLKEAIRLGLEKTPRGETFYILPTYSAMLDVRKILLGRKIL